MPGIRPASCYRPSPFPLSPFPLKRTLLVFLLLCQSISAQPPAWAGTWRLDLTQSEFVPAPRPYVRGERRIEASPGGIRIVEEFVRSRGGITHLEWTGALDGRDYRVHGVDLYVTYAYRQLDGRTWEGVVKVDGVVASRSRETVSVDGRTLTVETSGENAARGVRSAAVYVKVR